MFDYLLKLYKGITFKSVSDKIDKFKLNGSQKYLFVIEFQITSNKEWLSDKLKI